ncbi:MAG: nucleoside triphosphate pyrophosphohydrolase [Alphaproteobacteria bacterium]|nr:nucleoside triphosphate pyrophosphohydrolase [Alphaproteobacteria bacterium]
MRSFDTLVSIVARLRGPDGCPWDRAQTPATLRPYLVEESYEVIEAVESGDPDALRKELGDLLFQVVLLAQMAQDAGWFDMDAVCQAIADKMVRRHPHVFDPDHVEEDAGSVAAWEARKARERGAEVSMLDGLPKALPALVRAHRVGEKVSRVGFDWPDLAGVRAKVDEELAELDAELDAKDTAGIHAEYGDTLLALANLGRFIGLGPEEALRGANTRFDQRFRVVERLAAETGRPLTERSPEELEALWQRAKTLTPSGHADAGD